MRVGIGFGDIAPGREEASAEAGCQLRLRHPGLLNK